MRHDQAVMKAMFLLADARELLDGLVEETQNEKLVAASEVTREAVTRVSLYFTELTLERLKEIDNGTV